MIKPNFPEAEMIARESPTKKDFREAVIIGAAAGAISLWTDSLLRTAVEKHPTVGNAWWHILGSAAATLAIHGSHWLRARQEQKALTDELAEALSATEADIFSSPDVGTDAWYQGLTIRALFERVSANNAPGPSSPRRLPD